MTSPTNPQPTPPAGPWPRSPIHDEVAKMDESKLQGEQISTQPEEVKTCATDTKTQHPTTPRTSASAQAGETCEDVARSAEVASNAAPADGPNPSPGAADWCPLFKMDDGCEVSMFADGTLSWNEGSGPFLIFNKDETERFFTWIDNRPYRTPPPVAGSGPTAEEKALADCYMMARRQVNRLRHTSDIEGTQAWNHIIRFCESVGQKSSLLRDATPTEITGG